MQARHDPNEKWRSDGTDSRSAAQNETKRYTTVH